MNLLDLLAKGYFPKELPPPFHTEAFATHVATTAVPSGYVPAASVKPPVLTKCATHNLARAGSLRRRLSIPNPIAYHQLADIVSSNWATLLAYTAGSPISLSTPKETHRATRLIVPTTPIDAWPQHRARTRAGNRFVLIADVATFYPTVYTHSIPWAIHGKAFAKTSSSIAHLGNLLDFVIRNGQDRQTIGIPIGPDTSFLIHEILLTAIDKVLPNAMHHGIRYYDDYEVGCMTYAEAEVYLAALEEALALFELQLNPRKSAIKALPLPLEEFWTPDLRLYQFRPTPRSQATDILSFFGKAFSLQPQFPEDSILKYAVRRLRSEIIQPDNWTLYESLLLQAATVEPGTLPAVVDQLARYFRMGYALNLDRVADTFNRLIDAHAGRGHGSEVAWALSAAMELGLSIGRAAASRLSSSEDSVVALLALDARSRGLLGAGLDTSRWEALMTDPDLRGPGWLLSFEAVQQGWLRPFGGIDHIAGDPYFSWLRSGGVSFYDRTLVAGVTPSTPAPASGAASAPSAYS